MNDSKKVRFEQTLENSSVDFLANAPDEQVTAFFEEEGFDGNALAQRGRDALARARVAVARNLATNGSTEGAGPFASIHRAEYRNLSKTLGINTMFLNRIRDREVLLADYPARFLDRLAAGLHVTVETLRVYLALPPSPPVGGMFQADKKPAIASEAGPFRLVARESGLSEEEISRLFD